MIDKTGSHWPGSGDTQIELLAAVQCDWAQASFINGSLDAAGAGRFRVTHLKVNPIRVSAGGLCLTNAKIQPKPTFRPPAVINETPPWHLPRKPGVSVGQDLAAICLEGPSPTAAIITSPQILVTGPNKKGASMCESRVRYPL